MARKGRFGEQAPTDYAGNVLKQINQMNTTGDTAAEPGTTDGTTPKTRTPRTRPAPLTAEQIAKDPVLSGKISYDQARINFLKLQNALNLLPLAKANESAKYKAKATQMVRRSAAAMAKLTPDQRNAETSFFALGGKLTGTGKSEGANYGWDESKIASYWANAGMPEKGMEIIAKLRGYDQYGNDIPGGIDTSKNINYTLGKNANFNMASTTKGLTAVQSARLTKLKNLKQGGTTLGAKQLANLKKLRALAKG